VTARLAPADLIGPLVLALSRTAPAPQTVADARAALGETPVEGTWRELVDTARTMRVAPLMAWNLRTPATAGIVPPWVRAELDGLRERESARNRMLPTEVQRLLSIARAAGISVAVRKGCHMAHVVYPDIGLRSMGDIDLLVRPEQADDLAAALDAHGYQEGRPSGATIRPLERGAKVFWRLFGSGPPHRNRLTGDPARPVVTVDISASLFGPRQGYQAPTDVLLSRARPIVSRGVGLVVLDPQDTVLDLCANLFQNCTSLRTMNQGKHRRLVNFVDIADFLAAAGPSFSWPAFLDRVRAYDLVRPICYALSHVDQLWPGELPAEALASLRADCADWPALLTEYGHRDLPEPRRWQVDFPTRLFDATFDEQIPPSTSPV
jgi:hypothetical protein